MVDLCRGNVDDFVDCAYDREIRLVEGNCRHGHGALVPYSWMDAQGALTRLSHLPATEVGAPVARTGPLTQGEGQAKGHLCDKTIKRN